MRKTLGRLRASCGSDAVLSPSNCGFRRSGQLGYGTGFSDITSALAKDAEPQARPIVLKVDIHQSFGGGERVV
jgi:hypothetical protein